MTARIDETDSGGGESNGPPATTAVELYERLRGDRCAGCGSDSCTAVWAADEKDAVMAAFRDGQIDVLVCTTVIEVGVDVPNATVMVVMDADRFGISQLHQLRGRIGRGAHPSLCLLATRLPQDSRAGERLRAVAGTLDGFALADLDLQERREGDVLGLNQSGRSFTLRFLSLAEHLDLIVAARELCQELYAADPDSRGMVVLAAQFTGGDRIEFLDKS